MKRCNEYEVELSAMLDGESDPATAVMLMDHISQCESCREFYRELRSFQSLVDDLSLEGDAESERRAVLYSYQPAGMRHSRSFIQLGRR